MKHTIKQLTLLSLLITHVSVYTMDQVHGDPHSSDADEEYVTIPAPEIYPATSFDSGLSWTYIPAQKRPENDTIQLQNDIERKQYAEEDATNSDTDSSQPSWLLKHEQRDSRHDCDDNGNNAELSLDDMNPEDQQFFNTMNQYLALPDQNAHAQNQPDKPVTLPQWQKSLFGLTPAGNDMFQYETATMSYSSPLDNAQDEQRRAVYRLIRSHTSQELKPRIDALLNKWQKLIDTDNNHINLLNVLIRTIEQWNSKPTTYTLTEYRRLMDMVDAQYSVFSQTQTRQLLKEIRSSKELHTLAHIYQTYKDNRYFGQEAKQYLEAYLGIDSNIQQDNTYLENNPAIRTCKAITPYFDMLCALAIDMHYAAQKAEIYNKQGSDVQIPPLPPLRAPNTESNALMRKMLQQQTAQQRQAILSCQTHSRDLTEYTTDEITLASMRESLDRFFVALSSIFTPIVDSQTHLYGPIKQALYVVNTATQPLQSAQNRLDFVTKQYKQIQRDCIAALKKTEKYKQEYTNDKFRDSITLASWLQSPYDQSFRCIYPGQSLKKILCAQYTTLNTLMHKILQLGDMLPQGPNSAPLLNQLETTARMVDQKRTALAPLAMHALFISVGNAGHAVENCSDTECEEIEQQLESSEPVSSANTALSGAASEQQGQSIVPPSTDHRSPLIPAGHQSSSDTIKITHTSNPTQSTAHNDTPADVTSPLALVLPINTASPGSAIQSSPVSSGTPESMGNTNVNMPEIYTTQTAKTGTGTAKTAHNTQNNTSARNTQPTKSTLSPITSAMSTTKIGVLAAGILGGAYTAYTYLPTLITQIKTGQWRQFLKKNTQSKLTAPTRTSTTLSSNNSTQIEVLT